MAAGVVHAFRGAVRRRIGWPDHGLFQRSAADSPLHPAQLYSAFTAFLLAAMLVAYFTVPHTPGMVFAVMMIFEGIARFVLELVRVEPPVMHINGFGLSLSMVLGMWLAVFGLFLALVFRAIGASERFATASPAAA